MKATTLRILSQKSCQPQVVWPVCSPSHSPSWISRYEPLLEEVVSKFYRNHWETSKLEACINLVSRDRAQELGQALVRDPQLVHSRDEQNWTLLHWAAASGAENCARLLIESGAQVNVHGLCQETPLHVADTSGLIKQLLQAGADPKAKDRFGMTAIDISASLEP